MLGHMSGTSKNSWEAELKGGVNFLWLLMPSHIICNYWEDTYLERFIYLLILWKEEKETRRKRRERGRQREKPFACWLPMVCHSQPETGARKFIQVSQNRNSNAWSIIYCPRHISRRLEQKWSNQDFRRLSNMGYGCPWLTYWTASVRPVLLLMCIHFQGKWEPVIW